MTVSISQKVIKTQFNANRYASVYNYKTDVNLTNLDLFTHGQPFDQFKVMDNTMT